ncbi:MAG TPA: conjugal transfer protein TraG N-terminal domain-containing protein, partial [Burkholderiaceae bacterium]|nr:conjugal transfer protein TraG N-terminal domain-containing protein [Burkholderiaceae bacterium]
MWPIDVVAFWNGAQMRDLLEAIVFIVGGADFAGLARSVVLVGLLAAVIGGIVRWRHESMYMFVVVFVVSAMVLLVPRTPVTVRDVRAGTAYVVNDVPVGAAFLVTLSSRLGYWLGNAFESAFIPVSDEAARFTRFGMAFPQRAVEAIRSVGAVTPTGRGFLNALMSECVVLEMIENPARAQEVFASANLEMTITQAGWLNPARYVVGPDGLSRSCPIMAIDTFNYLRANEVPQLQRLLGAQLVGMEPNPTAAVSGAIASAETALLNLSRSFADAAMQSMLRAGVGDGLQQSSHPDAVALASAFAAAQANVSSVINYRTMSKIAETLLPTLRNAVEFVALAAFPIVIVLVMGAGIGGAVLLRGYVMIFAWLALWPPLYAVVNYLMVRVDGSPMSRLLTEYGGDTMVAAKLIQHMGATSQDMAGMLAILVPVIAFALVRGGDIAASSLVSGILGP